MKNILNVCGHTIDVKATLNGAIMNDNFEILDVDITFIKKNILNGILEGSFVSPAKYLIRWEVKKNSKQSNFYVITVPKGSYEKIENPVLYELLDLEDAVLIKPEQVFHALNQGKLKERTFFMVDWNTKEIINETPEKKVFQLG